MHTSSLPTTAQSLSRRAASLGGEPRPLATTIYYLLTYDDPVGVFHMNKSVVRTFLLPYTQEHSADSAVSADDARPAPRAR